MQLIDRIKDKLKDENLKRLAENYFSLAFLQGLNYLIPLVTLPYLVRVLGIENFGLVQFANSLVLYFVIITDFGLNLFAPREIAVHRSDMRKVSEIFWSVYIIKGALVLVSFGLLTVIVLYFDRFNRESLLYLLSYGIVIGQAFFPIWFFQGMEKMKFIALLNIMSRLVFAVCIFSFVRGPDDFFVVPLSHTVGYLIAAGLSLWIALKRFRVQAFIPQRAALLDYVKRSFQFFLSRASVSMYTVSNTFVVGLFLGNATAGYYSAAEKLYNVMTSMYSPLSTALYPFMAHTRNLKLFRKIFTFTAAFNLVGCTVVFVGADLIIRIIFGDGFEMSANLLRFFAVLCSMNVPSALLGYPLLAALGHPRYANFSVVAASLAHLGMLAAVMPFIAHLNVYVIPVLLLITQTIVISIRIYGVRKNLTGDAGDAACAA
ncbi:MAG: flippase [bacterium]|nr:flippase [bacterium]